MTGVIDVPFSRRPPKPRFPFIVESQLGKSVTQSTARSRSDVTFDGIRQLFERIVEQYDANDEKTAKILKKIVFLESSLDEIFETDRIERTDNNDSDPEFKSFLSDLLPVLDNIERLADLVVESGQKEWVRGITIFHEKILDVLNTRSVRTSAKKGMAFNPAHHESISMDYDSHLPAGSISDIIESGWLYKDSVLRFAKVIVAKNRE